VDVSFDQHQIEVTRPEDTDGLGRSQGAAQTVYENAMNAIDALTTHEQVDDYSA